VPFSIEQENERIYIPSGQGWWKIYRSLPLKINKKSGGEKWKIKKNQ